MSTYLELMNQAQDLLKEAEQVKRREIQSVIKEIQAKIAQFDLKESDIFKGIKSTAPKSKVAARYQGPNGELWTGRGRTPVWVIQAEQAGHSRDEFLIEEKQSNFT